MTRILTAAGKLIARKLAGSAKRRAAGLSWLREKLLKHDSSMSIKKYRLYGHELSYRRATELLHGLEEIFVDTIYQCDLGPRPFIIDCGANIGLSIIYFKQHHPDARIIAFEPDATNFELLCRNVSAFGCSGVQLEQRAVWNAETTLHFQGNGSMGSSLTAAGSKGSYAVQTARLGAFLDEPVDLLKIDIEGAEYEVMKDIAGRLGQVKRIFVEYHSGFEDASKLHEILGILLAAGFTYYIQEAAAVYPTPFDRDAEERQYDIQLNIFGFRAGTKG